MSTLPIDALSPRTSADALSIPNAHARTRLASIDALRGLVIVLMALDHVRDYFTNVSFDPLDLSQTTLELFLTRWVTHLCAPTFIFLAGVSAYLMSKKLETPALRRFLLTRGLWLIALEFTVVQFAWTFNLRYEHGLFMQVIWAIGASMIVLSLVVSWPRWLIGTCSLVLIAGHNLLDGIEPETFGQWSWVWNLVHVQGELTYAFLLYPLIPWIAVMGLGFYAGVVFDLESDTRKRVLLRVGAMCLVAFVLLRAMNVYGDPHPWSGQSTVTLTLLDFLSVHKYPPSLLYLLATLGIASILLGYLEKLKGRAFEVMQTFGRVPLFVYVLHIVLAHLAAGSIALAMGFGDVLLKNLFLTAPEGWGFGLLGVYLAWIGVLMALYPACRWFGELKRRKRDWWLAYL